MKRFKELLPGLDTKTLFADYPKVLMMDLKKVCGPLLGMNALFVARVLAYDMMCELLDKLKILLRRVGQRRHDDACHHDTMASKSRCLNPRTPHGQ